MKSILAAIGLILATAAPARAQVEGLRRFDISYTVRAGGIAVGEADYAFTFQGSTYQATSSRRMTGLARSLMGARQDFTYAARGEIGEDGQVHPSTYQHEDGHRHRIVQVSFTADGVNTVARPPMGMGNPPATPAQKAGTIDQLSMFAQMLLARGDPCRQTIRVFMDGRTRFDLTLTPNGRQNVSVAGFRGQAYKCAVAFTPISGFSDPQAPARLTFLFAAVNGYFVPVSVEMPTQDVGVIRLEARRFNVTGRR